MIVTAHAGWLDYWSLLRLELANIPQATQITLTTTLLHDFQVLHAKYASMNARIEALRPRGTPLQCRELADDIAMAAKPRISTETEVSNLKRTLRDVEDRLVPAVAALDIHEAFVGIGMRTLAEQYSIVAAFERGDIHREEREQWPRYSRLRKECNTMLVNAKNATERSFAKALDVSMREWKARMRVDAAKLDERIKHRDLNFFMLLAFANALGIKVARQRMIKEFFPVESGGGT